jgi:putative oxidoreductase
VHSADVAVLVLRLVAGAIFIVQGYRKTFAPPDAKGSGAALTAMIARQGLPAPALLARAVALTELCGGLLLVAGLLTRLAAAALAVTMIVAIVKFKWKDGFQGGWDWPLSVLGLTLALVLLGAGLISADRLIGLAVVVDPVSSGGAYG